MRDLPGADVLPVAYASLTSPSDGSETIIMSKLVLEKRSFPRVSLHASGLFVYREGRYHARLENISQAGALISLQEEDGPPIERGERCTLELQRGGFGPALRLNCRLVHCDFGMACLRFVNLDQKSRLVLRSTIAHQMPESCPAPARSSLCRA